MVSVLLHPQKLPARLRKAENTECWLPSGESFLDFFLARRVSPGGWGTLWVAASASSFTSLHSPASFFSLIFSKSSAIELSLLRKSKRETVVTHVSRKHPNKNWRKTAAVYWHNIDETLKRLLKVNARSIVFFQRGLSLPSWDSGYDHLGTLAVIVAEKNNGTMTAFTWRLWRAMPPCPTWGILVSNICNGWASAHEIETAKGGKCSCQTTEDQAWVHGKQDA